MTDDSIRKTTLWTFVCIIVVINIGIGVNIYLENKKPKHSPPPPAVVEQPAPAPTPEPEAPRVPVHWNIPEMPMSCVIVGGEMVDTEETNNYLIVRRADGTQDIIKNVDVSIWKSVEIGDFIN